MGNGDKISQTSECFLELRQCSHEEHLHLKRILQALDFASAALEARHNFLSCV